jgi:NAD-dependent oxidoreductase involved in siderophore biosynthesis
MTDAEFLDHIDLLCETAVPVLMTGGGTVFMSQQVILNGTDLTRFSELAAQHGFYLVTNTFFAHSLARYVNDLRTSIAEKMAKRLRS